MACSLFRRPDRLNETRRLPRPNLLPPSWLRHELRLLQPCCFGSSLTLDGFAQISVFRTAVIFAVGVDPRLRPVACPLHLVVPEPVMRSAWETPVADRRI